MFVEASWRNLGLNIMFISVHAPHDMESKRGLWVQLLHLISNFFGEYIIMGDFNVVK